MGDAANDRGSSVAEPDTAAADTVVVWLWAETPGPQWDRCFRLLNPEEQARALRMRAGVPRDEFVTGRAALRVLLGQRLGIAPATVVLRTGPHGKPEADGVRTSVAHSHRLIGVAVARNGEIGLDVEWVDPAVETEEIAQAHFSPAERSALAQSRAPEGRTGMFFDLWTRKEAVLKALGTGLGGGLGAGLDVCGGDRVDAAERTVFLLRLGLAGVAGGSGWVAHLARADRMPVAREAVWGPGWLTQMPGTGAGVEERR